MKRALLASNVTTRPQLDAVWVKADSAIRVSSLGLPPPWDGAPVPADLAATLPSPRKGGQEVDATLKIASAAEALTDLDIQARMRRLGWIHEGNSIFALTRRRRWLWLLALIHVNFSGETILEAIPALRRRLRRVFRLAITLESARDDLTLRLRGRADRLDARRLNKMLDSLVAGGLAGYVVSPPGEKSNGVSREDKAFS